MGMQSCMGAMLQCSFGVAPAQLIVLPTACVLGDKPLATIMDHKPMLNVLPFGMCQSMANPMVAAATAAAMGVLTPMPCIPNTTSPWIVGAPTVLIGGNPALNDSAKLVCAWGGMIQQSFPGQVKIQVP